MNTRLIVECAICGTEIRSGSPCLTLEIYLTYQPSHSDQIGVADADVIVCGAECAIRQCAVLLREAQAGPVCDTPPLASVAPEERLRAAIEAMTGTMTDEQIAERIAETRRLLAARGGT